MKKKCVLSDFALRSKLPYVGVVVLALMGCAKRAFHEENSSQKNLANPFDKRSLVEKLTEECKTGKIGSGTAVECREVGEEEEIKQAAAQAVTLVLDAQKAQSSGASQPALWKRDVHPKHHGCIKGTFNVSSNTPQEYQVGLFANIGKTYPVWSRISNSGLTSNMSDNAGDFRGMTFKVIGATGPRLLSGFESSISTDFLFVNVPFFVAKNIKEYNTQLAFKQNPSLGNTLNASLKTNLLLLTKKALDASKMVNPLNESYFSITSFKLGDNAVRYRAIPCASKRNLGNEGKSGDNKFREALAATLERENGCYEIEARRLLIPSWIMNEDVTKTWEEHVEGAMPFKLGGYSDSQKAEAYAKVFSPWSQIATVDFPKQKFESEKQQSFCENSSFNVWRTIEEMRPLGNLNRARQVVYAEVSKARRTKNHVSELEPTGEEDFSK